MPFFVSNHSIKQTALEGMTFIKIMFKNLVLTVNTMHIHCIFFKTTSCLMLCREVLTVCFEHHTEHILAVCSKCRDSVNIIAHGVYGNHRLNGMKGSVTHYIAETMWKNLCTLFSICKYIKVCQEWEVRLILIWHLFKCPFLWFFLLNWTWCSFFADTRVN